VRQYTLSASEFEAPAKIAIDWSQCPDVESVPDRCHGAPVVKGTRVMVQGIIDNAGAGCSAEQIAHEIYDLDLEAVQRILDFAHPLVRCRSCGWVHVGCPAPEPAGDRCNRCKRSAFEIIDREEYRRSVPIGVTLQGLRWPR
jgi:uncharacterized protein (DUF433 family)